MHYIFLNKADNFFVMPNPKKNEEKGKQFVMPNPKENEGKGKFFYKTENECEL